MPDPIEVRIANFLDHCSPLALRVCEESARNAKSELERDQAYMSFLLEIASSAAERGEVPIAACLVDRETGEVLDLASNHREEKRNPLAHAETELLQHFAARQQSWRCSNTALYVTLEPCLMCCGSILQARVAEVIYASRDPKCGCVESQAQVFDLKMPGHRVHYRSAVLEAEASKLLKDFFKDLRKRNQRLKEKLGSASERRKLARSGAKPLTLAETDEDK
ncbi:MAG: deaminase [Eubacteriales bacterium]|nr:deaminase [Eubacteriales bacterium]